MWVKFGFKNAFLEIESVAMLRGSNLIKKRP